MLAFELTTGVFCMAEQNRAQRISVAFAYLFYLAALCCIGAVAWFAMEHGSGHPSVAAFAASVVFFIGAGVVLHVMGRADLPDLKLHR
jgi:hypothetical protein